MLGQCEAKCEWGPPHLIRKHPTLLTSPPSAHMCGAQVDIANLWVSISTIALAFVFIFGNSVKNLYEAVLFLFVIHAFDVGDWIQLSNGQVVKVRAHDDGHGSHKRLHDGNAMCAWTVYLTMPSCIFVTYMKSLKA